MFVKINSHGIFSPAIKKLPNYSNVTVQMDITKETHAQNYLVGTINKTP
jgi:hypothetical protein